MMNLKPIKPKRISDQVFEQIRELIYKGDFKPGQQILPERELAASMAVSRTSVRNAINKLVGMDLLEHRQGQGTFVTSPDLRKETTWERDLATDEATLDDLLEVRLGLECYAAQFAAQRATGSDLKALLKALEEMEDDLAATDKIGTVPDTAFHMAIAYSTKNPVLIHVMRNFYDFLFVGIKKNLTHMVMDREALEKVISQHKTVYDAISRKAPDEAFTAMQLHIHYIQEYFQSR